MSDEDIFGDFEDLETGEIHTADDKELSEGEGEGEGDENDESEEKKTEGDEGRLEKKKKQKAAFDAMYPWNKNPFAASMSNQSIEHSW